MATTKQATEAAVEKDNAEVQAIVDDDNAKGYRGSVPDARPNSDYSLESGPDSPDLADTYQESRNT